MAAPHTLPPSASHSAESSSGLFGGNSNWRGPIWFPVNYLMIESLQRFHHYLGDDYQVECPTGSGCWMNLWQVASELSQRLIAIFEQDATGERPVNGGCPPLRHICNVQHRRRCRLKCHDLFRRESIDLRCLSPLFSL